MIFVYFYWKNMVRHSFSNKISASKTRRDKFCRQFGPLSSWLELWSGRQQTINTLNSEYLHLKIGRPQFGTKIMCCNYIFSKYLFIVIENLWNKLYFLSTYSWTFSCMFCRCITRYQGKIFQHHFLQIFHRLTLLYVTSN